MFKVGDIVEITEESYATGMLDFVDGKGYTVEAVDDTSNAVMLLNESWVARWYHCAHFNLKEGAKLEKKECLFKEGQVVWDVRVGKGKVACVYEEGGYHTVVEVLFENGETDLYTKDGKLSETDKLQSLYFSEPKIEAATEPLFEPALKAGDVVVAVDKEAPHKRLAIKVYEEDMVLVKSDYGTMFNKKLFDFYKVGEKIEFS